MVRPDMTDQQRIERVEAGLGRVTGDVVASSIHNDPAPVPRDILTRDIVEKGGSTHGPVVHPLAEGEPHEVRRIGAAAQKVEHRVADGEDLPRLREFFDLWTVRHGIVATHTRKQCKENHLNLGSWSYL